MRVSVSLRVIVLFHPTGWKCSGFGECLYVSWPVCNRCCDGYADLKRDNKNLEDLVCIQGERDDSGAAPCPKTPQNPYDSTSKRLS